MQASPLLSSAILPCGAVLLPCDAPAWVSSGQQQQQQQEQQSEELLAQLSLLVSTPCRYEGAGAVLTDEQRQHDAEEWMCTFTQYGVLAADSQLVFMLRCGSGQLQLAFLAQAARDQVKARLDALSSARAVKVEGAE